MKRISIITLFICFQVQFTFGKQHVIEMSDAEFMPSSLNIGIGDTVTWINKSNMQHTTTSGTACEKDGKWNSDIVNPGEKFTYVFKSAGSFPYFCIPHCLSDMVGTITVSAKKERENTDQNTTQPATKPDPVAEPEHKQHRPSEKSTFRNTRIINAQSSETLKKGILEFRVVHRWDDLIGKRGGPHLFFGLDNLRDERLSLEYGITNNLMFGAGRCKGDYSNFAVQQVYELYDFFAKYSLLRQEEKKMPVSLVLYGNSVISAVRPKRIAGSEANFENESERWSFVFQPIIARKFSNLLSIEVLPTYLRRNWARNGDEKDLFSIGTAGSLHFTKRFGIVAEYFYTFSDYRKNSPVNFYNPLALGVEFNTGGHIFTINLSNATGIIENTFIPYTTASWQKNEFRLGFSIHRKFNLNKKNKPKKQ
ncbi:MAG: DUF5777 family beta-barrel protein [Bacteroidia bacterium]